MREIRDVSSLSLSLSLSGTHIVSHGSEEKEGEIGKESESGRQIQRSSLDDDEKELNVGRRSDGITIKFQLQMPHAQKVLSLLIPTPH